MWRTVSAVFGSLLMLTGNISLSIGQDFDDFEVFGIEFSMTCQDSSGTLAYPYMDYEKTGDQIREVNNGREWRITKIVKSDDANERYIINRHSDGLPGLLPAYTIVVLVDFGNSVVIEKTVVDEAERDRYPELHNQETIERCSRIK